VRRPPGTARAAGLIAGESGATHVVPNTWMCEYRSARNANNFCMPHPPSRLKVNNKLIIAM